MKKSRIVVSLIIIAAILCVAFWVRSYHEKKNAERMHELEILYKHQNTAFGMCHDNLDNRIYYHGSDEVNKKFILIATIAYNRDQEKYVLTEQDIITYLDSEYDESGELRVYNRPAAIDDYIEWYYHGGDEKVDYCRSEIDHYLINHNYTENTMEISYEKLVEVNEKYKNSDEYDYIRKKGNQATYGIELTPEILEKYFSTKREMEERGCSEEEIEEAINQLIAEYYDGEYVR